MPVPKVAFENSFNPRRLYQEIALQVKAHIENGEYSFGTKLPAERELAEQLKVSRTSVREAFIALEVEGLVEVQPGTGVCVCQPQLAFPSHASSEGPRELMRARIVIEGKTDPTAARQAMQRHLRKVHGRLTKQLRTCRRPLRIAIANRVKHQIPPKVNDA